MNMAKQVYYHKRRKVMKIFEDLMYESGLTAQGCWDEMDSYDKEAIMKFAELIVRECLLKIGGAKIRNESYAELIERIKEDFGVEE